MRFFDYIRLAFLNLIRQKLRTSLTIISVVIGAIAVLSLISLGSTAKSVFLEQLKSVGAMTKINVIGQVDGGGSEEGNFSKSNVRQIDNSDKEVKLDENIIKKIKNIKHVKAVTPVVDLWDVEGIRNKGKTYTTKISGVGLGAKLNLNAGSFFKDENEHSLVIGSAYLKRIGFKSVEDAIGKQVQLVTRTDYQVEGTAIKPQEIVQARKNKSQPSK